MSKVDKDQLKLTLDALVEAGVLTGWATRPLGIYWLFTPDGSKLTPDLKETAMWAMGASATMLAVEEGLVAASRSEPQTRFEPAQVSEFLQAMVQIGALTKWRIDDDGDFEMESPDEHFWIGPSQIGAFISGATVVYQAGTRNSG
jgi:hypothetical protein